MPTEPNAAACSFCGVTLQNTKWLIANGGASMCDECLGRCNDILEEAEPS